MTNERGPRGPPMRLGEDFSDEEATVLDVSLPAIEAKLKSAARAAPPASSTKRVPDLDKTEMLERPALGDVRSRAAANAAPLPRGVVPLGKGAKRLVGQAGADGDAPDDDDDDAETVQLSRPSPLQEEPTDSFSSVLRSRPEAGASVRPLDEVAHEPLLSDASEDRTLSRPKIARMTFRPEATPPVDAEPYADTAKRRQAREGAPPAPRPLPSPPAPKPKAKRQPAPPPPPVDTSAEDPGAGRLIIAAPPDAVVFVDGVEHGKGMLFLEGLDRYAKISLRVHRPGHRAWTRSVSLDGRRELTVTPDLNRR